MNREQTHKKLLSMWQEMDAEIARNREFGGEDRDDIHEEAIDKLARRSKYPVDKNNVLVKLAVTLAQVGSAASHWEAQEPGVVMLFEVLEYFDSTDVSVVQGGEERSIAGIAKTIKIMGEYANFLYALSKLSAEAAKLMEESSQKTRVNIMRAYAGLGDL